MSMQTYPMYDIGIVLVELLPYLNKAAMEMYPEQYGLSPEEEKILQMSDADFIDAAKGGSLPLGFYDDEPLHDIFEEDSNTNKTQFVTAFDGSAETNSEVMETYKSQEHAFSREYHQSGFYDDHIMYWPLPKEPKLFSQAYSSPDDIVSEFMDAFKAYLKYLPENYDIARLICTIDGTTFS